MSDPNTKQTTATEADRKALARCWECWEDSEGADVGYPAIRRLTDIGLLERTGRDQWIVTDEGNDALREMGVL